MRVWRRRAWLVISALAVVGACSSSPDEGSVTAEVDREWYLTGYQVTSLEWNDDPSFDAGFSVYVAAWPFQRTYPGAAFQSGLPGTWLYRAEIDGDPTAEIYSTIEGGLGWWNDNRFATETPKFIMGGVAADFSEWANGPGAGAGLSDVDRRDWDVPQGKYGVVQLSPYVVWAPDGLNLRPGSDGGLFGYGYHPLPLFDPQPATADRPTATGDRTWTLFLDTGNFRGPVAAFVPNFFSKPTLEDPSLEGAFFDSRGSDANRPIQMETQVIPAAHAVAADGVAYARVTAMQFPASDDDSSILVTRLHSYSDGALRTAVTDWFEGGPVASGRFDPAFTLSNDFQPIDVAEASSYVISTSDDAERYPIDWDLLADMDVSDPSTLRYRWNLDVVRREGDFFVLPEFYRLERAGSTMSWRPVDAADVPPETGLVDYEFPELGTRPDDEPYTTPDDPESPWMSPGPSSGPIEIELGDGSTVTYSWYRFIDQPAIRAWGFSDEQMAVLQARVEAIHRAWLPDATYLAPPSVGTLAELDPAIVVQPPAGFEVGYVPIVTRQERTAG
jgi:hypothetical protein